jgi:C1A family cysteine protease
MSVIVRTFKWKPDVPDYRDHMFSLPVKAVLPKFINPLGSKSPIEDQGNLGSCTGNAATTALEIALNTPTQYSRLMAYYNARLLEGSVRYDSGAYIRDVIKGIKMYGVSQERLWPYNISRFAIKPPAAAYKDAISVMPKIGTYERLTTLDDIKTALAAGLPAVFGFSVPAYFVGAEVAKTGWVRLPTRSDNMIGGHAVTAIGYDERAPDPYVWVRNSWGARWGINGNFKMPYGWFTNNLRLVDDIWVIHPKVH